VLNLDISSLLRTTVQRWTDPTKFQGHGRHRRYFEGWYFKVVLPEHNLAYAFIPGISYDEQGQGHAFLQVLDGVAATSTYHRFPVADFRPARDRFYLELGPHRFATDRLYIDLPDLKLDLHYENVHPWPARPLSPGVMGWYGFVPRMQCYHGLVSFHHQLSGTITVNGQHYDATGGVGYTEKDWGSGFPDAWVWLQSNHLSATDRPASLMASVASIPWLGSSFTGFLCTFLLDGELHLFTTWARAQVQAKFPKDGESVHLTFSNKTHRLTITGHPTAGGNLASPIAGAMTGKINESLQATLDIELYNNKKTVYKGQASWAGLEVSENAPHIL
jgi:hypothetical protein